MASNVTVIGRGARVRGRIVGAGAAAGDLEILGFVEGEIAVGGDVTIDATGIVGANVGGRKLVVRGSRGANRAAAAAAPRPAAHAPARAPAAPHAIAAPAPAIRLAGGRPEAASASGARDKRRPPPPIVPVLKKAKGQIAAKKKER